MSPDWLPSANGLQSTDGPQESICPPQIKLRSRSFCFLVYNAPKWIHPVHIWRRQRRVTRREGKSERNVICVWIRKQPTPLIGRPGCSCLVTAFDDAIHTCCDEKFKLTCELFSGNAAAWDEDVRRDVRFSRCKTNIKRKHTVGFLLFFFFYARFPARVSTRHVDEVRSTFIRNIQTGANVSGQILVGLRSAVCNQRGRCSINVSDPFLHLQ